MEEFDSLKIKKRIKWHLGLPYQVKFLRWYANHISDIYINETSLIGVSNLDPYGNSYQRATSVEWMALTIIDNENACKSRADNLETRY